MSEIRLTANDADTLIGLYEEYKSATGRAPSRAARSRLQSWLCTARAVGYPEQAMADVLGMTRQRIHQLAPFAAQIPNVAPIEGPAEPPVDLPWPTVLKPWHRWPRPSLSDAERDTLVEWQKLATTTRGCTPLDDPSRAAGDELAVALNDLIEERGFTYTELANILGISRMGIRARLKNRGFKNGAAPSQPGYQRKQTDRSRPTSHGTPSGYQRCVKRAEGSCQVCREAHMTYMKARYTPRFRHPLERQWRKLSEVQRRMLLVLSETPRRSNPSHGFSQWVPSSKKLTELGLLVPSSSFTLTAQGSDLMAWVRSNLETAAEEGAA